jgi:hypothetical protein
VWQHADSVAASAPSSNWSVPAATRRSPEPLHTACCWKAKSCRLMLSTSSAAKGRWFSRREIFSRTSSFSMLMLATTDWNRRFSSSSTSVSRLIRPDSLLARKDAFRRDDHRPAPPAPDDSGDYSVVPRTPSGAPESCFFVADMGVRLHEFLPTCCPSKFRATQAKHRLTYRVPFALFTAQKSPNCSLESDHSSSEGRGNVPLSSFLSNCCA